MDRPGARLTPRRIAVIGGGLVIGILAGWFVIVAFVAVVAILVAR